MAVTHALATARLHVKRWQGKRRPAIELRNNHSGVPALLDEGEGNTACGVIQRVMHPDELPENIVALYQFGSKYGSYPLR